eukprot:7415-Heterococcus_DN1.PRE.1
MPKKRPPTAAQPTKRYAVLKWFNSLTVPQRTQVLTTCDTEWARAVADMAAQLRRRAGATDASSSCTRFLVERPGAGGAIQLMDDPLLAAKLASLSVNMNMSTRATITPFTVDELEGWGSRMAADGSGALERAALAYSRGATVTFAYSFAADVPALVRAVDAVSYDQFLRCESSTAAASVWTTTQWLERMGAHSLGAFLANRIE